MPNRCVCYTTDSNYLFPTFVSAIQARRHVAGTIADVAVFSLGASVQQEKVFTRVAAMEGLRFFSVPPHHLDGADAMLARLFLSRIVPDDYQQLLYIDGDTQIVGSLVPLLEMDVPAGHFCAVNDPMTFTFRGNVNDKDMAEYFESLGLDSVMQRNYFNSGVLRINRTGWDEIGREAWALYQKLRGSSRFPDQDALNLAAIGRRIPISLCWNFPVFLRNARLRNAISPHIVHYMGSPKPWYGQFSPWGAAEHEAYLTVLRQYPALAPYIGSMPISRRLKYRLKQNYKKITELAAWGSGNRHSEILLYEAEAKQGLAHYPA